MKIGIAVQARMNSQRLPAKVLQPIKGKEMLTYLLDRLERVGGVDQVVVNTSQEKTDDPIAHFCENKKVACFRGSLNNVAQRFMSLVTEFKWDAVVRLSGDSPLIDPKLVEEALKHFKDKKVDVVSNVFPRTYPSGQSVEVFTKQALASALEKMNDKADFEHVTQYFYTHSAGFKIYNFEAEQDYAQVKMSVDTPKDMALFERVITVMEQEVSSYNVQDLYQLYLECAE